VIAWNTPHQDGSSTGIYAQRFNSDDTPLGSEFQVNTFWQGVQSGPNVLGLKNGGFVIAWTSGHDGNNKGVFAQLFDNSGVPLGLEFQVNTYALGYQVGPQMAALPNGDFMITWNSYHSQFWTLPDGSSYKGIYARRYDSSGVEIGEEFKVNTYTAHNQDQPRIATLFDGTFVITWTSKNQDGSERGVYGQYFSETGSPLGDEFQVNTFTTGNQQRSAVAGLANGGFVVAFESHKMSSIEAGASLTNINPDAEIFTQRYQIQAGRRALSGRLPLVNRLIMQDE